MGPEFDFTITRFNVPVAELVALGCRPGALESPAAADAVAAAQTGKTVGEFTIRAMLLHRGKGQVYGVGAPFILDGHGRGDNDQDDGVLKDVCDTDPGPDRVAHGKLQFALAIEVRGPDLPFVKRWHDRRVDFGLKKLTPLIPKSGQFQIVAVTEN